MLVMWSGKCTVSTSNLHWRNAIVQHIRGNSSHCE